MKQENRSHWTLLSISDLEMSGYVNLTIVLAPVKAVTVTRVSDGMTSCSTAVDEVALKRRTTRVGSSATFPGRRPVGVGLPACCRCSRRPQVRHDPLLPFVCVGFGEVQHSAIVHVSREAHNPRSRRGRLVLAEVHVGLLLLVGEHAGRVLVSERYRLPSSRPLIVC
jgi:hypothetical protein